jgi:hypothetical protein
MRISGGSWAAGARAGSAKIRSWLLPAALVFSAALCLAHLGHARGQDKPVAPARDDSDARLAKRKTPPPANCPRGYKGLLLADVNPKNAYKDEVIADFGGLGLWVDEQMTWTQISANDPDWILDISLDDTPKKEIIADFGEKGVWKWTHNGYPGDWKQLSGNNAQWAIALDDDKDKRQELHVVFGKPPGIWRYDEATGGAGTWKQLSPFTPSFGLRTATRPGGPEEGCYSFPGKGVWTVSFAGGVVHAEQLSGMEIDGDDAASAPFTGGPGDDLIIDFAAKGLWLCRNSDHAWQQITDRGADRIGQVQFGPGGRRLLVDFNGDEGLFYWTYGGSPGKLTRLSPEDPDAGFCETFDRDGPNEKGDGQELAVDFGKSGLWLYEYSTNTWALINTKNPVFMVRGDYWGKGFDSTLAVSFGTDGLWLYEGKSGGWYQISSNAPDCGL